MSLIEIVDISFEWVCKIFLLSVVSLITAFITLKPSHESCYCDIKMFLRFLNLTTKILVICQYVFLPLLILISIFGLIMYLSIDISKTFIYFLVIINSIFFFRTLINIKRELKEIITTTQQ